MLTVGQVWDFERLIQVEQSNVYRLSAHAERHCVTDEVSYLERLVNARKLLMEQRSDMLRELERCQSSIEQLDGAIDLLDAILNDDAQLSEPDREA
jgi:vacuolar-type H+-ATPase subunit I/STV1